MGVKIEACRVVPARRQDGHFRKGAGAQAQPPWDAEERTPMIDGTPPATGPCRRNDV